ncbi:cytochrome c biogenesis protein DipZ [Sphingomicrobium clamense]|uniref:Cytochrome c biogenesis protein DipZ n=1 Tax=Sphingomicrobium clamense TaxID=2851013 RepID=A0ABS6V8P3_9SPHN|nr:cytochrome c biogenesis protein DipZ [Sphingomicrobium sp. B8]MBW0145433.1 cytochrome c biogenesis protein DipZ [Sphingomicrobium sp. B8]
MTLILLLAYLGGILTILSPCILPVLPFVFARADKPFLRHGLPMLAGMAVTFAGVATLTAFAGEWAVGANNAGRYIALAIMSLFALMLIVPSLADRVMAPVANLGNRLSGSEDGGPAGSALLGVATGLLWAPCAGPILGLILTGAALSGASGETALLLLAYSAGAATSLAGALLVGGKLYAKMKASLGAGQAIRKALGVLILVAVAAIALGLDTRVLARLSAGPTNQIEQGLAKVLGMESRDLTTALDDGPLPDEEPWPGLEGGTLWLDGTPLTPADLDGKVVLVDFWTYSCINCVRTAPFVEAWHQRYEDDGLVIVGVHTPEFAFERDADNVRKAVRDQRITYEVVLDNNWAIWRAFENRFWPAHYLRDAGGRLRYHHFGEGGHMETELAIRKLLVEAGADLSPEWSDAALDDRQMQADFKRIGTRETYLGWKRAKNFASPGGFAQDETKLYRPAELADNEWSLSGVWQVERQRAIAGEINPVLSINFSARDANLVLTSIDGQPKRGRIQLDGEAPGADAGVDVAPDGSFTIDGQRVYQLVRQSDGARRRLLTIALEDGTAAYAFTFG